MTTRGWCPCAISNDAHEWRSVNSGEELILPQFVGSLSSPITRIA